MGSLVTAVASYLDIKQRAGRWLVRVDNIDPPREAAGAETQILNALHVHNLRPDAVLFQAQHTDKYTSALDQLSPWCFYCTCSRRELRDHPAYPGTCRNERTPVEDAAIRCLTNGEVITWTDAINGRHTVAIDQAFGDFILRRRDGLWGYNLACAVDDGNGQVTHVLRGDDLLDVTAPQILLMQRLYPAISPPEYAHIPVLRFEDGTKLSKQTQAPPLQLDDPAENLRSALYYLGMQPPAGARATNEWLSWAMEKWNLSNLTTVLPAYHAH
jgi:glutamyl-Q tRNA(Asp) synthetase